MQFDDVAYREPHKARRPDLDPRLACVAYRVVGHDDLPIFLEKGPADAIERHALRDVSVELGGILLGKECVDEVNGKPFVWVTEALEAKHYENTQASFTYTHESWAEITRERDEKFPELDIVGWYHTHPDFGIFLSSHDLFIHHNFFDQPLQVAYVVDPIRQDRGFFFWRDGKMVQTGGFYLTASRPERMALSKLVNDLEGLSTADGGGGGGSGLSPRLEAELIAMLSRPQTVAMAADRGQSAAVFTLVGAMAGSLVVLAAFWLQALGRDVKDQARQIEILADAQKKSIATAKDSLVAERVSAKEEALDSLLGELKVDPSAPEVATKLSQVVAQRDEAKQEAARARVQVEALIEKATALDARAAQIRSDAEAALKKSATNFRDLQADYIEKRDKVEELTERLGESDKTLADNVSGGLQKKYNWAFYAAVAGWLGFLGCGVALLAALTREEPSRDDERSGDEPPIHKITIT